MGADRAVRWMAAALWLVTLPFVRIVIRGGACVPGMGAAVLAANHRSMFDLPVALVTMRHFGVPARVLVASEIAEAWWAGGMARALGIIPVRRRVAPMEALAAGVQTLRAGHCIAIMPEGTITWDPARPLALGRPRTGVSRLAVGAGRPVLPIAIAGTERVWPKGRRLPRPALHRRLVVVQVGDELLHLEGDDHRANAARVMDAIGELLEQASAAAR